MSSPYIIAACITATPTLVVGILGWYNAREAKKTAARTHEVVKGNGKGDVAHMLETTLSWQEAHERRDRKQFKKVNKELKQLAIQGSTQPPSPSNGSGVETEVSSRS